MRARLKFAICRRLWVPYRAVGALTRPRTDATTLFRVFNMTQVCSFRRQHSRYLVYLFRVSLENKREITLHRESNRGGNTLFYCRFSSSLLSTDIQLCESLATPLFPKFHKISFSLFFFFFSFHVSAVALFVSTFYAKSRWQLLFFKHRIDPL